MPFFDPYLQRKWEVQKSSPRTMVILGDAPLHVLRKVTAQGPAEPRRRPLALASSVVPLLCAPQKEHALPRIPELSGHFGVRGTWRSFLLVKADHLLAVKETVLRPKGLPKSNRRVQASELTGG